MKTDVQIAQEAQMKPIVEVASQLDISDDELELYGKYKAKISPDVLERLKDRPNGKLVLVTAINRLGRRRKDHHERGTVYGAEQAGKEDHYHAERAVSGTVLRH